MVSILDVVVCSNPDVNTSVLDILMAVLLSVTPAPVFLISILAKTGTGVPEDTEIFCAPEPVKMAVPEPAPSVTAVVEDIFRFPPYAPLWL